MENKNKKLFRILIMVILLILSISLTYAYFSANITGAEDDTTITVTGGVMNIVYNGGADINISNIVPSNNPFVIKSFTVTGNNTTDIKMSYELNLIIENNTFSDNVIKYKLESINTDNNGEVIPSNNELTNILSGINNIPLGIGTFNAPTDGNRVHTYNLELYFPETGENQNQEQGKNIKGYISIRGYNDPCLDGKCLKDKIISDGGGVDVIHARGTPDYNQINGISGIYESDDDYGLSYYYRGEKELLNNNLIWGGL